MARSARRPKAAARKRPSAFRNGAMALGGLIAENPVLVGGSTAFLVTLFYVSANALWYQPFPHTGAFFATRSVAHFPVGTAEPETTINIVRPEPAPAPASPAAPVPAPAAAAKPAAARDPVVEQVQGILKDLGFYSDAVDGLTGPNTQSAIAAYQRKVSRDAALTALETLKKHGMQVTELSPADLDKMREMVKPVVEKYTQEVGEDTIKSMYAEIDKIRKP